MYRLATCFWVSLRTLSPQGLSIAPDILRFFSLFQAVYLLTSGWIEPLLVGGYAPFSPVVEYRSVRFGISYYTIWDIVLYDLKYRTIRFGISYYTIWDIVLYDFEYRTIRF